jgi:hypothetical protein
MNVSEAAGTGSPVEGPVNAVLVGGPLAGRMISAPALDQPVRIQDDDRVWQEYHPAPEINQSVHGQPADLAVFRHYMPAEDADRLDDEGSPNRG